MDIELNPRQRFLNIFSHKKIDKIVFSPRLYYWYFGNKLFSKRKKSSRANIPPNYIGKSQLEIYDYLGATPRYSDETLYLPLITAKINSNMGIEIKSKPGSKQDETIIIHKTPLGDLKRAQNIGGGFGAHLTEYPIKSLDDIKIMKYLLENTIVSFIKENYEKAENILGNRGVVSTYLWRSPYQKLITEFMGFSRTILFLKRYTSQMENFMKFLEEWDDKMYHEIAKSPLEIVNFGENIDCNLSPPPYFEKYLIPYYDKRVKELHQAGKYCHIHLDGSLKDLLPYFENLPFDGLEALTPQPQGDVSLEELKAAIDNKIFLDGIPSILFLPEYSNDYVREYTQKVLDMFSPNLILGVSDELSPNGDIRKVEMIAEMVKQFAP